MRQRELRLERCDGRAVTLALVPPPAPVVVVFSIGGSRSRLHPREAPARMRAVTGDSSESTSAAVEAHQIGGRKAEARADPARFRPSPPRPSAPESEVAPSPAACRTARSHRGPRTAPRRGSGDDSRRRTGARRTIRRRSAAAQATQSVETLAHVGRLGAEIDPGRGRQAQHSDSSARSSATSQRGLGAGPDQVSRAPPGSSTTVSPEAAGSLVSANTTDRNAGAAGGSSVPKTPHQR